MRHQGWWIGVLLPMVGLSGCAKKAGWASYPVTIYADQTTVQSSERTADLNDAFEFWNKKAGKQLFAFQGQWNGGAPYTGSASNVTSIQANVLFFLNPWAFASNIAGQTTTHASSGTEIDGAVIMMNPNVSMCSGDCVGEENMTSERKAFTHELGHFLGLQHVNDPNNIMYPTIQPGGSLEEVTIDETAFQALMN